MGAAFGNIPGNDSLRSLLTRQAKGTLTQYTAREILDKHFIRDDPFIQNADYLCVKQQGKMLTVFGVPDRTRAIKIAKLFQERFGNVYETFFRRCGKHVAPTFCLEPSDGDSSYFAVSNTGEHVTSLALASLENNTRACLRRKGIEEGKHYSGIALDPTMIGVVVSGVNSHDLARAIKYSLLELQAPPAVPINRVSIQTGFGGKALEWDIEVSALETPASIQSSVPDNYVHPLLSGLSELHVMLPQHVHRALVLEEGGPIVLKYDILKARLAKSGVHAPMVFVDCATDPTQNEIIVSSGGKSFSAPMAEFSAEKLIAVLAQSISELQIQESEAKNGLRVCRRSEIVFERSRLTERVLRDELSVSTITEETGLSSDHPQFDETALRIFDRKFTAMVKYFSKIEQRRLPNVLAALALHYLNASSLRQDDWRINAAKSALGPPGALTPLNAKRFLTQFFSIPNEHEREPSINDVRAKLQERVRDTLSAATTEGGFSPYLLTQIQFFERCVAQPLFNGDNTSKMFYEVSRLVDRCVALPAWTATERITIEMLPRASDYLQQFHTGLIRQLQWTTVKPELTIFARDRGEASSREDSTASKLLLNKILGHLAQADSLPAVLPLLLSTLSPPLMTSVRNKLVQSIQSAFEGIFKDERRWPESSYLWRICYSFGVEPRELKISQHIKHQVAATMRQLRKSAENRAYNRELETTYKKLFACFGCRLFTAKEIKLITSAAPEQKRSFFARLHRDARNSSDEAFKKSSRVIDILLVQRKLTLKESESVQRAIVQQERIHNYEAANALRRSVEYRAQAQSGASFDSRQSARLLAMQILQPEFLSAFSDVPLHASIEKVYNYLTMSSARREYTRTRSREIDLCKAFWTEIHGERQVIPLLLQEAREIQASNPLRAVEHLEEAISQAQEIRQDRVGSYVKRRLAKLVQRIPDAPEDARRLSARYLLEIGIESFIHDSQQLQQEQESLDAHQCSQTSNTVKALQAGLAASLPFQTELEIAVLACKAKCSLLFYDSTLESSESIEDLMQEQVSRMLETITLSVHQQCRNPQKQLENLQNAGALLLESIRWLHTTATYFDQPIDLDPVISEIVTSSWNNVLTAFNQSSSYARSLVQHWSDVRIDIASTFIRKALRSCDIERAREHLRACQRDTDRTIRARHAKLEKLIVDLGEC